MNAVRLSFEITPATVVGLLALVAAVATMKNAWPTSFRVFTSVLLMAFAAALFLVRFGSDLGLPAALMLSSSESDVALPAIAAVLFFVALYRLVRPPTDSASVDVARLIKSSRSLVTAPAARPRSAQRGGRRWVALKTQLSRDGNVRTRRLDRALKHCMGRRGQSLSFLVGARGAGKSSALRRLAKECMPRMRRPVTTPAIPVYVDLSRLVAATPIDAELLREHVAGLLSDGDPSLKLTVLRYLRESRDTIRWRFLFDAFEETPAFVSAKNVAAEKEHCLRAIGHLTESLPGARTIVAGQDSFEPRLPSTVTTLRILGLSAWQQRSFIRAAGLSRRTAKALAQRVRIDPTVRSLADNPLTLEVLCEYASTTGPDNLPGTLFEVFDRAIRTRLALSTAIADGSGSLPPPEVLERYAVARHLALAVITDEQPNNTPWQRLLDSMARRGLADNVAAERTAVALCEAGIAVIQRQDGNLATFSFSHRLFRDCLAAALLISSTDAVGREELLTAERWRDVAPLVFRHVSQQSMAAFFDVVEHQLRRAIDITPGIVDSIPSDSTSVVVSKPERFAWPQETVTPLKMLADVVRSEGLPVQETLQGLVDVLVTSAFVSGATYDRSIALDVLPLASPGVAQWSIARWTTFNSLADLRGRALQVAANLTTLPPKEAPHIRLLLLREALAGRRAWFFNPKTPDATLPRSFSVLRTIMAVSTLIFVARFAYEIVRPALNGDFRPQAATAFIVLAGLAVVWHQACIGRASLASLITFAAWLFGLIGLLSAAYSVANLSLLIWHLFLGQWTEARDDAISLLLVLAALWPSLAITALVCGGAESEILIRPYMPLWRLGRRWLSEHAIPSPKVLSAVGGVCALAICLLFEVEGSSYIKGNAAEHVATIIGKAVFGALAVGLLLVVLLWDRVRDAAWRRSHPIQDVAALRGDQLREMLADAPSAASLTWLLQQLKHKAEGDRDLMKESADFLLDLDHCLDHLSRTMPADQMWSVRGTTWDDVRPFRDGDFVSFLRDPRMAYRKLCWLTRFHRHTIANLRQLAETAPSPAILPAQAAGGIQAVHNTDAR